MFSLVQRNPGVRYGVRAEVVHFRLSTLDEPRRLMRRRGTAHGDALVDVNVGMRGERPERQDVAFIATQYRLQPGLDILVPVEMYELYTSPTAGRIEVRSEYSKYRRFSVSVLEQVAR
jgi:hypothetical protein